VSDRKQIHRASHDSRLRVGDVIKLPNHRCCAVDTPPGLYNCPEEYLTPRLAVWMTEIEGDAAPETKGARDVRVGAPGPDRRCRSGGRAGRGWSCTGPRSRPSQVNDGADGGGDDSDAFDADRHS
jgi:hypothetical protein